MKKKIIIFSSIGAAALIAAIILIICLCLPKSSKAYRTIKVYDTKGIVKVIRNNDSMDAKNQMSLKNEDRVEVGSESSIVLKLDSDKFIMAKENTKLKLEATGKANNTKTRILVDEGGVIVEVKEQLQKDETFDLASSNSVMAIRGTRVEFDVEVNNDEVISHTKLLKGKVETTAFKKDAEAISMLTTTILDNTCITVKTSKSNLIDRDELINHFDNNEKNIVSNSELTTATGATFRELTSEEIDAIVDAVNSFEREEDKYINGTIKFNVKPSSVEYGLDPKDYIELDKEYENVTFYYCETIDGEYKLYDSTNPLYLGNYYCKALSEDAYRSDPFLFSVSIRQLNLSVNVEQANYMGTSTLNLSLDKEIFDMLDFDMLEESGHQNKYKYYICLELPDSGYSKISYIDYSNQNVMVNKVKNDICKRR